MIIGNGCSSIGGRIAIRLALVAALLLPQFATASQPLLNVMQGCQAALDFVVEKVDAKPPNATDDELNAIREALVNYNDAIQQQVITPGLNTFNGGDANKVAAMQAQIDAYKATIIAAYKKRYPQPQLFGDYAVSINQCTTQWLPKFADTEPLTEALLSIIAIAQRK